ncbi:MAG: hypothetical protein GX647_11840 [Clostridiales bacterium]|jgi:hypothetical protein|nr:hypothetical protein [Clostridiales bacterium]
MTWIAYALAGLVLLAAAWIAVKGVVRFIRTKGQSACDSCPYANTCGKTKGDCK